MRVSPVLASKLRARRIPAAGRFSVATPGEVITGNVVSFADGDGFRLNLPGRTANIRLWAIDAPEWGQHHARQAWLHLQSLVWGRPVTCYIHDRDRYGRLVCECYTNAPFSLNLIQVLYGFAWHCPKYAPDEIHYRDAQRLARINRRGIWVADNPVPPWVYRHSVKHRRSFSDV
jgi:micrococcal nuclease